MVPCSEVVYIYKYAAMGFFILFILSEGIGLTRKLPSQSTVLEVIRDIAVAFFGRNRK